MDDELAQVFGYESAEDYKRSMAEHEELHTKSEKLYGKQPNEWPTITINWDYRPESQRYCFDGLSKSEFDEFYPNGLVLGHIPLREFDRYLCHFSRRDGDELWKIGSQSKLAKMIIFLSEGKPITPPVIKPVENNEVIFQGGHHRYAVAKAIGLREIPIYAYIEGVDELNRFMNIRWV